MKIKPEYTLTPDEKKETLPHETDLEKTLKMQLAFTKGVLHSVLNEAKEYMDWAANRRIHQGKSRVWKWKVAHMKVFYSHLERRIQELEWRLPKIKYKSKP